MQRRARRKGVGEIEYIREVEMEISGVETDCFWDVALSAPGVVCMLKQ